MRLRGDDFVSYTIIFTPLFVGCVPQARTRLLKSNSRVRVGYAATHPTHETRPLRGSPCERGAYSAELQIAPKPTYKALRMICKQALNRFSEPV